MRTLALVPFDGPVFCPRPGAPLGVDCRLGSSPPVKTFFSPNFVNVSMGLSVFVPPSFFPGTLGIFWFGFEASEPSSSIASSESLPPPPTLTVSGCRRQKERVPADPLLPSQPSLFFPPTLGRLLLGSWVVLSPASVEASTVSPRRCLS